MHHRSAGIPAIEIIRLGVPLRKSSSSVTGAYAENILADSTKFGRRGFGKICGLDVIDHIITDSGVPGQFVGPSKARVLR